MRWINREGSIRVAVAKDNWVRRKCRVNRVLHEEGAEEEIEIMERNLAEETSKTRRVDGRLR